MKRVAIFCCEKIKDHTCIAGAKCFKGVQERTGEFAQHNDGVKSKFQEKFGKPVIIGTHHY